MTKGIEFKPDYKKLTYLVEVKELNYREIANIYNVHPSTISRHYRRHRKDLNFLDKIRYYFKTG